MIKIAFFSAKEYEKSVFSPFFEKQTLPISCTYFDAALSPKTAALASGYDTVCVFVNDVVNQQTLEALTNFDVKHIALRCAGYNQVNVEAANSMGLTISRVPSYSPEAVAEHTLALIMTLNRKLHKAYNRVRDGNFELQGLQGFTLNNKTVGVIGTGKIGLAFMRILKGFGCNLLCYDIHENPEALLIGASYVSLDQLLEQSHVISLHCPLNTDTHHLIDPHAISLMRNNVMLVNTSRGGLIDTHAVIQGLKSGKIGYLGLDVYEMESELFFKDWSNSIIQDDIIGRLLTFPNVLITGHQGFFTNEAVNEIVACTTKNIVAFHTDTIPAENVVT